MEKVKGKSWFKYLYIISFCMIIVLCGLLCYKYIKVNQSLKESDDDKANVNLIEDKSGANRPVLAEGMIPVIYDNTLNTWVKADAKGIYSNWYDYENKMWANAVMVTSGTRDTYMNADAGTEIKEDDVLAYYVWIPRYKYKLFNVDFKIIDSQVIDVVFEKGTESTGTTKCSVSEIGVETCTNKENGNYYTHPAFTFGDIELEGIWVGKYETTGSTSSPTVKPGITSLRSITVANMYSTGQLLGSTNYLTSSGVNVTNSHMMKNIEWGAVAYLKQSKYGLGITDIGLNNNSDYKTGCGVVAGSSSSSTCNAYNTTTGMLASTTGNITGVYDMSGGTWEYVMGNYTKTAGDSGLTVGGVPSNHIDIYAGTSESYSHLGDALGETAGWYSDFTYFVNDIYPWFLRGGYFNDGDLAGVFYFNGGTGGANIALSFRVVISTTE